MTPGTPEFRDALAAARFEIKRSTASMVRDERVHRRPVVVTLIDGVEVSRRLMRVTYADPIDKQPARKVKLL